VSAPEPRWGRLHVAVIGALVIEIVLLAALSARSW
jgi:hypothetical protein